MIRWATPWLVIAVVTPALTTTSAAGAHDGVHDEMPNQLNVGFIPIYISQYDGAHAGLTEGPIDELNLWATGAVVSYSYTFWHHLEVKLRSEYIKVYPGREALDDGLHEFRGTVGINGIIGLFDDQMQIAVGPDFGVAAWRLTEIEDPATQPTFESSHALGYTLGFNAALRGWITYHTGFWLEIGFGVSDASSAGGEGAGIASRWPLRLGLGWADRF